MVPGDGFPQVSHLIVSQKKGRMIIPWGAISLFTRLVISVKGALTEFPVYAEAENEILVKRDILDKQIVDVDGAKVVRVNDLKLGKYQRVSLYSFRGYRSGRTAPSPRLRKVRPRRLSVLLGKEIPHQEISWEYVQPLEMNLSRLALTMAHDQLAEMHPADLAAIISNISHQHIQDGTDLPRHRNRR